MDFHQAMDRLREGKRVRRRDWPVEKVAAGTKIAGGDGGLDYIVPEAFVRVWHLFVVKDFLKPECVSFWTDGLVNGWGYSVGGGSETDHNVVVVERA